MKLIAILLCLLTLLTPLPASEKFTASAAGVSIIFPDGWKHDAEDTFGFVIKPMSNKMKTGKVRIHMTAHQGISPTVAVQQGISHTNEIKVKKKQPPEKLIRSKSIITRSGINGEKATIGDESADGHAYLNRYYFLKPDGSIFCVCVYFYGDLAFEKQVEESIVESLAFIE